MKLYADDAASIVVGALTLENGQDRIAVYGSVGLTRDRVGASSKTLNELLSLAADALDDRFPLAATILRRAMINFTLRVARSTRYKRAARHCKTAGQLRRE